MGQEAPEDEYTGLRERLSELVGAGLDRLVPVTGPADLELIALDLARPFADPEVPREAAALLPQVLGERGDELAAGLLSALELLTPEPLAGLAGAAAARLARAGVASSQAAGLGTLVADECYAIVPGEGGHEIVGALLRRPGTAEAQAALLFLEPREGGAAIVDGELTPPGPEPQLRAMLCEPHPSIDGRPIASADCAQRLLRALGHMVERGVELPAQSLAPLLVLERALGAGVAGWPQPFVGSAHAVADDAADERRRAEVEELVEGFERSLDWRQGDARLLEYGGFVAHGLCTWKLDHGDEVRIGRWYAYEFADYLLGWYPRQGDSEPELVAALPDCVQAFLRFLDDAGRLGGDPVELLCRTVERLRTRFEEAALDARNWGPSKRLLAEMRKDGVDPGDAEALAAWLEAFNARPFAERDRVVGPALAHRSEGASGAWPTELRRRRARRDAKAARRRNRR